MRRLGGQVRPAVARLLLVVALLGWPALAPAASEPASWPARGAAAAPPAPPASDTRLYVLAFSDVPIAQVAEDVLGGVLGVGYGVDPAVHGVMSFHVEQRLTPRQLLAEFEAALQRNGAALTRQDGRYLLTPRVAAPAPPSPSARALDPAPPPPIPTPQAAARPWLILMGFSLAGALVSMLLLIRLLPPARVSSNGVTLGALGAAARRAVFDHLVRRGPIAPEVMERAQRLAESGQRPLERVLHGLGAVSDAQLVEAYAAVTGCAPWRPQDQPPLTDAPEAEDLARLGLVLVARAPRRLTLASADPLDDDVIGQAARQTGRTLTILVGSPSDIAAACPGQGGAVIPYDPAHNRASG